VVFVGVGVQRSLEKFQREVSEFVAKLPTQHLVPFHKKLTLELAARVIAKTPVDTGRARGNWQVTVETPAEGEVERKDRTGAADAQAGQAFAAAAAALRDLQPYRATWLANNVPYILVLESGLYPLRPRRGSGRTSGGFSTQAPAGMVSLSLQELLVMFREPEL